MKINDSELRINEPEVRSEDKDSSRSTDDKEPSPFSRLLAKKKGADQDTDLLKQGKAGASDTLQAASMFSQADRLFDPSLKTQEIEGKQIVSLPADLQQLVREISVVVNSAGNQQVNIEMNSNVLKGLHVRIERRDGALAIQFQSASDQVAGLLSRNMESLSQGLAERGVNVAEVRVSGPKEVSRGRDSKGQSNFGGRGQGGRQGGGR